MLKLFLASFVLFVGMVVYFQNNTPANNEEGQECFSTPSLSGPEQVRYCKPVESALICSLRVETQDSNTSESIPCTVFDNAKKYHEATFAWFPWFVK